MKTTAEKIIEFDKNLDFKGKLPSGYYALNPYLDNPETIEVMEKFYTKFYSDQNPRRLILGINPSRHGAGVTGVPFTDTKRLKSVCGIEVKSAHTHELSSVFVYDLIQAFGGPEKFYSKFYINSPFPLAIIKISSGGKPKNANYYDDADLFKACKNFMKESLLNHVKVGVKTDEVFILGKKNAEFIKVLNDEMKLFKKLTVLEHPRYIQQYKSREKDFYIQKYLDAFNQPEK